MNLIAVDKNNYSVLGNLMQLYLYDFSTFFCDDDDGKVDEYGCFDAGFRLERYRDGRDGEYHYKGWLARSDGHWAGFALVGSRLLDDAPGTGWNVDEFFVMRCDRRQGIGREMARQVFDTVRGYWQISQVDGNASAQAFWRAVIGDYTGGRFKDFTRVNDWGETVVWQTFDSGEW